MADNPNAELIAIGTELLLGEITDTNSVFMARQLRDIGVNVFFMTTVGDNLARIAAAIDLALGRAEVVITCGGLGPTVDDMTRLAIADATGCPLDFHQPLYDAIVERFRGFGVPMTDNNRQQAYLPRGAAVIENPVGTAPGFIVETARGIVISVPGVPREMQYLMTASVLPYLLGKYDLGVIVGRTLRTAGVGESSLDDMIGADILNESNPSVGLAAHHGCVDVRITAKAKSKDAAIRLLDGMQARLEERIGDHLYGIDGATLEEEVARLLQASQQRIHVIEAGLPGVLSERISSETALVSACAYAHPDEIFALHQRDPTRVSLREMAVLVAQEALSRDNVQCSMAVLSYPDIDENRDIEEGSAIAVATANETAYRDYGFGARSNLAREWLSRWGFANLWRLLKNGSDRSREPD